MSKDDFDGGDKEGPCRMTVWQADFDADSVEEPSRVTDRSLSGYTSPDPDEQTLNLMSIRGDQYSPKLLKRPKKSQQHLTRYARFPKKTLNYINGDICKNYKSQERMVQLL